MSDRKALYMHLFDTDNFFRRLLNIVSLVFPPLLPPPPPNHQCRGASVRPVRMCVWCTTKGHLQCAEAKFRRPLLGARARARDDWQTLGGKKKGGRGGGQVGTYAHELAAWWIMEWPDELWPLRGGGGGNVCVCVCVRCLCALPKKKKTCTYYAWSNLSAYLIIDTLPDDGSSRNV